MDAITRAVYHASLIYAYQALAPITEATAEIGTSLPILLAEIEFLTSGPVHSFSHDIFVPLFIAGTECWGDVGRQDAVERRFRELLAAMGIWCNFTALRFLKGFWERGSYHRVGGWIPYARENEGDNGPFLVF
jgi:formylmethanofuran dehydrogenase subunit B